MTSTPEPDFDRTAESSRFDLVTAFDAIHDQKAPDRVLRARALPEPGACEMRVHFHVPLFFTSAGPLASTTMSAAPGAAGAHPYTDGSWAGDAD